MEAVASGRRVRRRFPRSSNVYISLRTMSLDSPEVRVNSSVLSKAGVSTYRYPCRRATLTARSESARMRLPSGGSRSCVPLGGLKSTAASGELAEERIGRAFQSDRGGLAVARVHVQLVGKAQEPAEAVEYVLPRRVREAIHSDRPAGDAFSAEEQPC